MLRLVLLIMCLCSSAAFSKESSYRETNSKTDISQVQTDINIGNQQTTPRSNGAMTNQNVTSTKHTDVESQCSPSTSWKEWPSLAICRSVEWLTAERTVALFTVILGLATGLLWVATRDLVNEARKTSERQLRAYISVTPEKVLNWTNPPHAIGITFTMRNHGQTPGIEVSAETSMEIRSSEPDISTVAQQNDFNTAIFPGSELPTQIFTPVRFTDQQIKQVESGDCRVYTWGQLHYRDVFGKKRTTTINFSFGGPDFSRKIRKGDGTGWNWAYGHKHNEPT